MADHGHVEYATAQGNDVATHEAMYERFTHWMLVGGAHVANILLGLAIGGVTGHWLVAFAIFVVATIVSFHGFLSGARLPVYRHPKPRSARCALFASVTLPVSGGSGVGEKNWPPQFAVPNTTVNGTCAIGVVRTAAMQIGGTVGVGVMVGVDVGVRVTHPLAPHASQQLAT